MILLTTAGKERSAAARLIAERDVPARVLVRPPRRRPIWPKLESRFFRAIWTHPRASTRQCGASRGSLSSPSRFSHRS